MQTFVDEKKVALAGNRLLRAESVEAMTSNQLPDSAYPLEQNGKRDGVGSGFSVVVEKTAYTSVSRCQADRLRCDQSPPPGPPETEREVTQLVFFGRRISTWRTDSSKKSR